jgi:hypothetical protein
MTLLGRRDRQRVQEIAEQVAQHAVAVAGGALPPEGRDAEESLATIDAALAVLAEAQENSAREVQRLAAAGGTPHGAAHAPPHAVLILAELRDRLRTVAVQPAAADLSAGTLSWVIARLDEALVGLEIREFTDDGAIDAQRHQIVDRRPADSNHAAGTIARSVRSGLTLAGAMLRPQQVVVYTDGRGNTDA